MFRKMAVLEKKFIFDDLLRSQGVFLIKAETEEVIQAQLQRMDTDQKGICALVGKLGQVPKENKVIVNFAVEEERYFMQTEMDLQKNVVVLDLSKDVFQLQRRKTVRLEIPLEMDALASVISYDGKPVLFETRILDFSAGGCRLSYNAKSPFFDVASKIKLVIKFHSRNPFEVEGVVRHTFAKSEEAKIPQVFGVQFELGKGVMQSKLATIFMDLQREIFTKYHADK